jgi:hypothetical protein
VRTDDDQEYSLYSDTALTLAAGATVRVYIETGTSPVECGPGLPARAIKVQLVQ